MQQASASDPSAGPPTGIAALIGRIAGLVARILCGEAALAQADLRRGLGDAARGAAFVAGAAMIGLLGAGALVAAGILGLIALGLPPWGAALAGAVILILAAMGVLQVGLRLLDPRNLAPRRSLESLRRDADLFRQMVKPDGTSDR